jgi:lipid II:glycine glycyltransferase (peptidoglycan interpeptide bridge formation enzyme)
MQRSGMSFMSAKDFALVNKLLSSPERAICGVAYHEGIPLGALFVPFTKARAFYLFGGSAAEMTIPGANKLLHWEAIRSLRQKEVADYDFVGARLSDVRGTKLEDIQRFKARFGGELQRGYLWKTDIVKPIAKVFDLLVTVKRYLHGNLTSGTGDIIDQERGKKWLCGNQLQVEAFGKQAKEA